MLYVYVLWLFDLLGCYGVLVVVCVGVDVGEIVGEVW